MVKQQCRRHAEGASCKSGEHVASTLQGRQGMQLRCPAPQADLAELVGRQLIAGFSHNLQPHKVAQDPRYISKHKLDPSDLKTARQASRNSQCLVATR